MNNTSRGEFMQEKLVITIDTIIILYMEVKCVS